MAVIKYKNPKYVEGGTEDKYVSIPLLTTGSSKTVPTLDSAPTENTLSYTDADGEHNFQIGDFARVYEDNEYVFYQLYDITSDNRAQWKTASASIAYELTKGKVEAVLTGDITSHNHATQLTSSLANYVIKETGKGLSTNDYTDEEKEKVSNSLRLKEYVDVASLETLPSTPYNLRFTYTSATTQAINFADIDSVPEMQEFYLSILNNSDQELVQPLPNGDGWYSNEYSVTLANGTPTGLSLKKEFGVIMIRC